MSTKTAYFAEQKRIAHSASLKQQGAWLQWAENALPFDMSWKNLIWGGISPHIIKFVLEASVNWVRTPNLLKLWGLKSTSSCPLCGATVCSLHHILSNCTVALNDERYTWRHNSVLFEIHKVIQSHVAERNACVVNESLPHISTSFVPAGKPPTKSIKKLHSGLIAGSNDWKVLVDLPDSKYVFPPEIFATLERPDIVIWSGKLRKVLLIELTCPSEENIEVAQLRKQTRYLQLMDQITSNTNWSPSLYTIEVGARGFIAHSLERTFLRLGISRRILSKVCKRVSIIAARCSFAIYMSANSIIWDKNRSLITLDA